MSPSLQRSDGYDQKYSQNHLSQNTRGRTNKSWLSKEKTLQAGLEVQDRGVRNDEGVKKF